MKRNLFSILTPTYNRAEKFLPQTIKSVQRQKEKGFEHEHIIVDNASSDDTAKVVREFAKKDKRIKYIRNPKDAGPGPALNLAFKKSKGEFIVPLDDDDLLPHHSLQMRFDYMKGMPEIDWSFGYCLHVDQDRKYVGEWDSPAPTDNKTFLKKNLVNNLIINGTVTMRRKCVETVKGWDKNVDAGQDWAMWCSLLYYGLKPGLIKTYLSIYRFHPGQRSHINLKEGRWNKTKAYMLKKFKIKHSEKSWFVDKAG